VYKGIVPVIEGIIRRNRNANALRFAVTAPCAACGGTRLRPEALAVTVEGQTIADLAHWPVVDVLAYFEAWLDGGPAPGQVAVARPLARALVVRGRALVQLGLGHLSLDRPARTLSGGEAQRLRLARQLCHGLQHILYVLDEPSTGLHPHDADALRRCLRGLRDGGNSLLVVDHDVESLRQSDWLIDMGPGAAEAGGEVVYQGRPEDLLRAPAFRQGRSHTAAFLAGTRRVAVDVRCRRRHVGEGSLRLVGASLHNLRDVDVIFRLGAYNAVTGVAGAGKSTLVGEVLAQALAERRGKGAANTYRRLEGSEEVRQVIALDQSPIGRTPRSNAVTYTKAFDHIRAIFAAQPLARQRRWRKGRFSTNVKGGRCERCEGAGVERVGMHFLGDVEVPCSECGGRRFSEDTLAVRFRGHNIFEVLELTVDDAGRLFSDEPAVARVLEALRAVGLGYLRLGQPSPSLSGGEAQRVKLAGELARPTRGPTVYLLDEPMAGLHPADVEALLPHFHRLVDQGHTVVAVEHDPEVIKTADWVVDLGPGGGPAGGRVVAQGTPKEVAGSGSPTGRALEALFRQNAGPPPVEEGRSASPQRRGPITLRGVSTHNLRDVDIEIPHGQLTVITGPSGSGKSSLAFDTLAALGQQAYTESLSSYARRFMGQIGGDVNGTATGLSATLAVGQGEGRAGPRSTVATMADLSLLLRLLFARAGERYCPNCGRPLLGDGSCSGCDFQGGELRAQCFSPNDHRGACSTCRGVGVVPRCDPARLIRQPERPLYGGAMEGLPSAWARVHGDPEGQYAAILEALGRARSIDFGQPWDRLGAAAQGLALHGTGPETYEVQWEYNRRGRRGRHDWPATWDGLCNYAQREYEQRQGRRAAELRELMVDHPCAACEGEQLRPEYRAVRVAGRSLPWLWSQPLDHVLDFCLSLADGPWASVANALSKRLRSLIDVGLAYLTLRRRTDSLSVGERQRLRLATQVDSGLCGVTYVFDEPTSGLHARDTHRLVQMLRQLRDEGNTVVVVEHDLEVIGSADYIIDLGPGGGAKGGQVVASGSVEQVMQCDRSVTGPWLTGAESVASKATPGRLDPGVTIRGARAKNLQSLNLDLPRGALVAVTGVSGSGKTTLVFDVLAQSLKMGGAQGADQVTGGENFDEVLVVDHRPIANGSQRTPATYTGLFDVIRANFAALPEARRRKWNKAHFSFGSKAGRCETCRGRGFMAVEMGFMADVRHRCPACQGRRYRDEVLQLQLREQSIADVLSQTVDEAVAFWRDQSRIITGLTALQQVGLGYLPLGQAADQLSGGEAQRLRLATALLGPTSPRGRLYLLDEPTTGLHQREVAGLVSLLHELVGQGHSVVVVEHHLDVIGGAHWVVDLGPEGGPLGGRIIAQAPPAQLAQCGDSATGRALLRRGLVPRKGV
jgi:excinuclease ABC subunit A